MGEWFNYFKVCPVGTSSVLESGVEDLPVLSSQEDFKEALFSGLDVDIYGLKGSWSGFRARCRNGMNAIMVPVEVKKLMVANENAM